MEQIRVLYVNGGCMDFGGTSAYMMNYYRHINKSKVQIDFIVHGKENNAYADEIINSGGRIFCVPTKKEDFFGNRKAIDNILKSGDYKIIHSHMDGMNGYILKRAAKWNIQVRISHSHNTNHLTNNKIKLLFHEHIRKQIPEYATHLWACSKPAGEWLYGKDHEFEVIPNAIDTDKFVFCEEMRNKYREKYNLENKLVIGHVGRFDYQKNHVFLIDAFYELQRKLPDAVLVLTGDGHLMPEIKNKVKKLGIENKVIFAGQVYNVNEIINMFDLFVLPSLFEGMPVVAVEMQANGLMCLISSAVTDEAKLTDRVKFIDIDDPLKWSKAILDIRFEQMKRSGGMDEIKRAGYDIKAAAKNLEDRYLETLNQKEK